jgi:hypothetical protein
MFLRAYAGVPACDAFAEKWAPVMKEHQEAAIRHLRARNASKDPAEAFAEGVAAIREGFFFHECSDPDFLKSLAQARKDKKLKLPKEAAKEYDDLVPAFEKGIEEGYRSFEAAERKVKM